MNRFKNHEKLPDKIACFEPDLKYSGIGSVNNQVKNIDGSKCEKHQPEDRSFACILKNDEIYAYAQNDAAVYLILEHVLLGTEETLEENVRGDITTRLGLTYKDDNNRINLEEEEKTREIDKRISCGAFATLALLIRNRLFVINIGTVRCFIVKLVEMPNGGLSPQIVPLTFEHSLSNGDEKLRMSKLNAITDPSTLFGQQDTDEDDEFIDYTRCLGNFKLKNFYKQHNQFKECESRPVTSHPEHIPQSFEIDDKCLMMVMYSDGLAKSLLKIEPNLDEKLLNNKLADMIFDKIMQESTLNSAAQSVVDEIKRNYDDRYTHREDMTLLVRAFDENLKQIICKSQHDEFVETTNESLTATATNSSSQNSSLTAEEIVPEKSIGFDENGHVIPYIDFRQLDSHLTDDNLKLDEFEKVLNDLKSNDGGDEILDERL